ncbi:MAG TPA: ABC transporter permease [Gemmatimonadales bacterium]|nr:ABC transporter permease [Gemmatimonadales bacterium]
MPSDRPQFSLPSRNNRRMQADLDEELSFHREMRVDDLKAAGHSQANAERMADDEIASAAAARRNILREDQGSEFTRRRLRLARETMEDVKHALRSLRLAPGMALLVIFTLALGLGANVAIVAAVRSVLLAPLPYANPDELVSVYRTPLNAPEQEDAVAPGSWQLYDQLESFSSVAAWMQGGRAMDADDGPVPLEVAFVSSNLFSTLGVQMLLGRSFRPGEDSTGAPSVVVLSHRTWSTHFGSDSTVIGRQVLLGNNPVEIVGVSPRGFSLPGRSHELYTPLQRDALLANPELAQKRRFLRLVARLSDGTGYERAAAELQGAAAREALDWPEAHEGFTAQIRPVRETVRGGVRTPLLMLLGASTLVLLIACANVAGVLLARAIVRRRELAIRSALGAGRGRLTRQLLAESAVLAGLGGAAGIALAYAATAGLRVLTNGMMPPETTISLDGSTVLVSLGVVLISGALAGAVPALTAAGATMRTSLMSGRGDSADGSRQRARAALVMVQTAMAVILLVGAGLLTRTLVALNQVDLGYQVDGVLVFRVSPPFDRYPDAEAQSAFFDELHVRIGALQGVQAVGHTGIAPLNGPPTSSLAIDGRPAPGARLPEVNLGVVSDDYFGAMGIPLIRGRVFGPGDVGDAPSVVIVNDALARRYFPEGDAIGSRIRLGPDESAAWRTIVGVVGDTREAGADAPAAPMAYESSRQLPWGSAELVVRASGDPLSLVPAVRSVVRDMDDALPLLGVRALSDVLSGTLAPRRTPMVLLLAFAGIALVLASVGLYGITAYHVAARTREIGVRVALGAARGSVLGLVVRQGLKATVPGLVAGLIGAAFLSRLLGVLLYGVQPLDAITYVAVALLLLAVSLAALVVPARRALRIDPLVALRSE